MVIISETLIGYRQQCPVYRLEVLSEDKRVTTLYTTELQSGVSLLSLRMPEMDRLATHERVYQEQEHAA